MANPLVLLDLQENSEAESSLSEDDEIARNSSASTQPSDRNSGQWLPKSRSIGDGEQSTPSVSAFKAAQSLFETQAKSANVNLNTKTILKPNTVDAVIDKAAAPNVAHKSALSRTYEENIKQTNTSQFKSPKPSGASDTAQAVSNHFVETKSADFSKKYSAPQLHETAQPNALRSNKFLSEATSKVNDPEKFELIKIPNGTTNSNAASLASISSIQARSGNKRADGRKQEDVGEIGKNTPGINRQQTNHMKAPEFNTQEATSKAKNSEKNQHLHTPKGTIASNSASLVPSLQTKGLSEPSRNKEANGKLHNNGWDGGTLASKVVSGLDQQKTYIQAEIVSLNAPLRPQPEQDMGKLLQIHDDESPSRSVSNIRDVFAEKRGGEGGLGAALKISRGVYMELVSKVEDMRKKARRLDDLQKRRLNAHRSSGQPITSDKQQELIDISKVIWATVDRCSDAVQDFGSKQEEAERALNRANSAILSRMNLQEGGGPTSAAANRALIREERARVTEFLAAPETVRARHAEYESEVQQLLDLKMSMLPNEIESIQLEPSTPFNPPRFNGLLRTPEAISENAEVEIAPSTTSEITSLDTDKQTPPQGNEPEEDNDAVTASCFPSKTKATPKSSFSRRKQATFAFNEPDVVFKTAKAESPDQKPLRATLFFSPFAKRPAASPNRESRKNPPQSTSKEEKKDSATPLSRPNSGNADEIHNNIPAPQPPQNSQSFFQKAAHKLTKAMTSCEKQFASKWSQMISEPPHISAAIKDQVNKVIQYYEAEGFEALCKANETSKWNIAHYAAHHGSIRTLEFLASAAPRLFNQLDSAGNTPAHVAAARNQKQVLRLLHRYMRQSFNTRNAGGKLPSSCGNKQSRELIEALESNHGGPITPDVLATGRTFLRKTGINLT